jgi:hypothetical protein
LVLAAGGGFAPGQLAGIADTSPAAARAGLNDRLATLQPFAPQRVSLGELHDTLGQAL